MRWGEEVIQRQGSPTAHESDPEGFERVWLHSADLGCPPECAQVSIRILAFGVRLHSCRADPAVATLAKDRPIWIYIWLFKSIDEEELTW